MSPLLLFKSAQFLGIIYCWLSYYYIWLLFIIILLYYYYYYRLLLLQIIIIITNYYYFIIVNKLLLHPHIQIISIPSSGTQGPNPPPPGGAPTQSPTTAPEVPAEARLPRSPRPAWRSKTRSSGARIRSRSRRQRRHFGGNFIRDVVGIL